jgi:hypothetical protein
MFQFQKDYKRKQKAINDKRIRFILKNLADICKDVEKRQIKTLDFKEVNN